MKSHNELWINKVVSEWPTSTRNHNPTTIVSSKFVWWKFEEISQSWIEKLCHSKKTANIFFFKKKKIIFVDAIWWCQGQGQATHTCCLIKFREKTPVLPATSFKELLTAMCRNSTLSPLSNSTYWEISYEFNRKINITINVNWKFYTYFC